MLYDPIGSDEDGFEISPDLVTRVLKELPEYETVAMVVYDLGCLGFEELSDLAAAYREADAAV